MKLGTRGSELALVQANAVAAMLEQHAGISCEIVIIKTSGDRLAEAPLSEIGGKRLFVKEIEDALIAGDVDAAVHSSKDMPAVLPEGLEVGAVLAREDPHDAVVLPQTPSAREGQGSSPDAESGLQDVIRTLGRAPRIGTSSVRRIAQLTRMFPGASFLPVRGNLGTRLRKLDSGQFDALVLAAAGLRRLGQSARVSAILPAEACVPAPGQGIIAVEIRSGDERARQSLQRINDAAASAALRAERAVVIRLGGGCQMPIGAYAEVAGDMMTVTGVVVSADGALAARGSARGAPDNAEALGIDVAEQLLQQGADEILADVQQSQAPVEGIQP